MNARVTNTKLPSPPWMPQTRAALVRAGFLIYECCVARRSVRGIFSEWQLLSGQGQQVDAKSNKTIDFESAKHEGGMISPSRRAGRSCRRTACWSKPSSCATGRTSRRAITCSFRARAQAAREARAVSASNHAKPRRRGKGPAFISLRAPRRATAARLPPRPRSRSAARIRGSRTP